MYEKRDLPCRGLIRRWQTCGTFSILLLLLAVGGDDGLQLLLALLVCIAIAGIGDLLGLVDRGLLDV